MSIVDIAMATYNGALYLEEQIESIINQTYTDWRLLVRDDNSSDSTVEIVKQYAAKDPRIILIEDNLGGLRVSKNFETAISHCTAPYTMLADQDDVWFKTKIERSLAYIRSVEHQSQAVLVYSNSMLTNSDLSVELGLNYMSNSNPSFKNFIFHNAGYQGAAMIFNAQLRDKLFPFLERSKVHDFHISLVGLLQGEVYFLNESLMLYRRHLSTTTISNHTLKQRIKSFMSNSYMLSDEDMADYLSRFIADRSDVLSQSNKALFDAYFGIIDNTKPIVERIKIANKHGFTLRNSKAYLIIKLLLIKK